MSPQEKEIRECTSTCSGICPQGSCTIYVCSPARGCAMFLNSPTEECAISLHSPIGERTLCLCSPMGYCALYWGNYVYTYLPTGDRALCRCLPMDDCNLYQCLLTLGLRMYSAHPQEVFTLILRSPTWICFLFSCLPITCCTLFMRSLIGGLRKNISYFLSSVGLRRVSTLFVGRCAMLSHSHTRVENIYYGGIGNATN